MKNPPYDDGHKQRKLDDMIRRGFVVKHIDPDGIVRYELTKAGGMQWGAESVLGKVNHAFAFTFGMRPNG